MTKPTDAQLAALGAAFDTFAQRFKLAEAVDAEPSLNEIDKQALLYVAGHPDCGPTDIARHFGVANTTLTSAADRLVKRGLLDRSRPEGDRRAVALRLSEAGKERVNAFMAAHREMYRSLLAPLSTDDRDHLIRIMTKIANNEG